MSEGVLRFLFRPRTQKRDQLLKEIKESNAAALATLDRIYVQLPG
jgi:hypothetical protein